VVLLNACLPLHAQRPEGPRLYPVDDTNRSSSFRSWVKKLRSAVDARDPAALRKLVDPDVVVGPADDDRGWAKFLIRWRPGDRENASLWSSLATLLSLGFVQEHPQVFLSPYVVWRFPRELNPAAHLVVIREAAALRESPSVRAASSATLSFDIVQRIGEAEGDQDLVQWVRVRTLDGKTGYLNTREVMSPLIPRAQIGMVKGKWLMIALEGPLG